LWMNCIIRTWMRLMGTGLTLLWIYDSRERRVTIEFPC